MTFAWYGHLKHQGTALWKVILISGGIAPSLNTALCRFLPANRLGAQAVVSDSAEDHPGNSAIDRIRALCHFLPEGAFLLELSDLSLLYWERCISCLRSRITYSFHHLVIGVSTTLLADTVSLFLLTAFDLIKRIKVKVPLPPTRACPPYKQLRIFVVGID